MAKYQVAYTCDDDQQIVTDPVDYETAIKVATEINGDSGKDGYDPVAEVVLAPKK